jgi:hypothetical protein
MHVLTSTNDWCIGSKRACATILILWRRVVAASAPGGCVGGGPPGVGVAGPVFPPLVCVAVVCAPVALRPVDGWRLAACVVLVHAVRAVALQWCPPPVRCGAAVHAVCVGAARVHPPLPPCYILYFLSLILHNLD